MAMYRMLFGSTSNFFSFLNFKCIRENKKLSVPTLPLQSTILCRAFHFPNVPTFKRVFKHGPLK